jgi:hypothetical protein
MNCPASPLEETGWTARQIHDDLEATLGEEPIAYGTVR